MDTRGPQVTPAHISDSSEIIARAAALSREFGVSIAPGFEALVFKASRGIEDIYELTYLRKDGRRVPSVTPARPQCVDLSEMQHRSGP
jgi:hypothetical protein